jgi:hypothetical protein
MSQGEATNNLKLTSLLEIDRFVAVRDISAIKKSFVLKIDWM